MCSLVGALLHDITEHNIEDAEVVLTHVWHQAHQRGRDGRGYAHVYRKLGQGLHTGEARSVARVQGAGTTDLRPLLTHAARSAFIGNMRAEPTTEFVLDKQEHDQQPYALGEWMIVHNGTIANDAALRTGKHPTKIDSAAIVEVLDGVGANLQGFATAIRKLKGSFAILAVHRKHPDRMFAACNYRPIWYADTDDGTFFASSRSHFPEYMVPKMMRPYTVGEFTMDSKVLCSLNPLDGEPRAQKALVVCSGGLDSVVSATWAKVHNYDVTLLHFQYGSRAEGPEVAAVRAVAAKLGVGLIEHPMNVYRPGDSPLLDPDSKIAGGEAGAEFAYEWVPARNFVMLALATAIAEARGIELLVLGNNLEEAGAYPDNEPEFIDKLNDVLPFAIGDGKRLRIAMPVGNLMKHEIVALGHSLDAPMHLTWSCYRAGQQHCGTCGPCYMRRKAFEINKLIDPLEYLA